MSVFKSIFNMRTFQQNLGISQDEAFDPTKHDLSRKVRCPVDGQYEARNCFVPLCREVNSHTIETMHAKALHTILRFARAMNSTSRA